MSWSAGLRARVRPSGAPAVEVAVPEPGRYTAGPVVIDVDAFVRFVNAGLRMHVPSIVGAMTTPAIVAPPTPAAAVSGFSLVAEDGAMVRESLTARAVSLRRRELADLEGQAGERSQSMLVAQMFLVAGFLVFLVFPVVGVLLGVQGH